MLLPSDMSKSAVHRFYQRACKSEHVNCVSRHNIMMKSANMPESVKSRRLKDAQSHLDLARVQ